ncbi:MAG: U32 family peptidase [Prevotellaceae bacterium]|jgi:putative protease|nr:U32 family peptidase [Prevotellaceae bacterium]
MAPVGSHDALQAAIDGGASSVYFGVEKLNMRSRSSANFTLDDLAHIADICRRHGMESYLTLNVVLFDEELDAMREIVRRAKREGVSAIIASDQAAIDFAHSEGVEVHVSTQLNISNFEALKFYARYADVVVLARELSLHQVKRIAEQVAQHNVCGPRGELVKIEMFCHGALCMATSGKCYLSLHQSGLSANRGSCLQLCRRAYQLTERDSGFAIATDSEYLMSPKDLCTIEFVDVMLDAGVQVFKIEGRARSAEYVKTACECYRKAFEAVACGAYSGELKAELKEKLRRVYNRGFWDGYYMGAPLGEWSAVYGSAATTRKTYCAKALNYYARLGVAEFLLEAGSLKLGDTLLIMGPTTGVLELSIAQLHVGDAGTPTCEVRKGDVFSIAVPQRVRRADKLYLLQLTTL